MSDYPGCDCGHPWAEPSWIDHRPGCVYVAANLRDKWEEDPNVRLQ